MTPELINDLLDILPPDLQSELRNRIASKISERPYEILKNWFDCYDKESVIDMVIATALSGVLMEFVDQIKARKEEALRNTGKVLGECVIAALRIAKDKTTKSLQEAKEFHESRKKKNHNNINV